MLYEVIRLLICDKIRIYTDPYEVALLIEKICMRLGNKICSLKLICTDLKWPHAKRFPAEVVTRSTNF